VISLIIGAIILLLKVLALVVPILFVGALLIGGLLVDPHLIAVIRDGEEEKWICVAKYLD
jgi:hypothetical protein